MLDYVQLQADVAGALLSDPGLSLVNVVQYRKLRALSEVDASAIYAVPRSGKAGAGVLVEMPTLEVPAPNLPGPSGQLVVSCAVIEEPNLNMEASSGTLLAAEEVAQMVLDILHGLVIEGTGSLYADRSAIKPAEEFQGLVAYRVSLRLMSLRPQSDRVATPTITENGLNVTMACGTAGADMYYTQDGSFPGPGNSAAVKYTQTFAVTGAVLRWAAFKAGMVGSHVGEATAP